MCVRWKSKHIRRLIFQLILIKRYEPTHIDWKTFSILLIVKVRHGCRLKAGCKVKSETYQLNEKEFKFLHVVALNILYKQINKHSTLFTSDTYQRLIEMSYRRWREKSKKKETLKSYSIDFSIYVLDVDKWTWRKRMKKNGLKTLYD